MKFSFTDEQDMFRDTVRELFADRCPPDAVRQSWDNDDGRVPGLWAALAEMGVLAVLAPEAAGGLGMNEVDLVRILEEAGYAGVPEPLVEHVAVAIPALAEAGHAALEAAIAGDSTITLNLSGEVIVGAAADAVVHRTGDTLQLVTEWHADEATSIDQSRRLGVLTAPAVAAFGRPELGAAVRVGNDEPPARADMDSAIDWHGPNYRPQHRQPGV